MKAEARVKAKTISKSQEDKEQSSSQPREGSNPANTFISDFWPPDSGESMSLVNANRFVAFSFISEAVANWCRSWKSREGSKRGSESFPGEEGCGLSSGVSSACQGKWALSEAKPEEVRIPHGASSRGAALVTPCFWAREVWVGVSCRNAWQ